MHAVHARTRTVHSLVVARDIKGRPCCAISMHVADGLARIRQIVEKQQRRKAEQSANSSVSAVDTSHNSSALSESHDHSRDTYTVDIPHDNLDLAIPTRNTGTDARLDTDEGHRNRVNGEPAGGGDEPVPFVPRVYHSSREAVVVRSGVEAWTGDSDAVPSAMPRKVAAGGGFNTGRYICIKSKSHAHY